ncbi:hypothetical protein ACH5RR_031867 [Cinchona calisaya]|uniref:Uncharacterized protein n=1 Tax=Cinchona calisaya TaxID=153742 RepID=A0ABD2YKQ3_9GENT
MDPSGERGDSSVNWADAVYESGEEDSNLTMVDELVVQPTKVEEIEFCIGGDSSLTMVVTARDSVGDQG